MFNLKIFRAHRRLWPVAMGERLVHVDVAILGFAPAVHNQSLPESSEQPSSFAKCADDVPCSTTRVV